MSRTWKPQKGQWALELPGVEDPKPKRRPRVYLYENACTDGAFVIRTPDYEEVDEVLRSMSVHAYWSALYRGKIIAKRHLRDLVAAFQSLGWYVRIKPYDLAPA